MSLMVDKSRCIGCGACIVQCPFEALELIDGIVVVTEDRCKSCGLCVGVCPTETLSLPNRTKKTKKAAECPLPEAVQTTAQADPAQKPFLYQPGEERTEWKGVWVVIEYQLGKVAPVSWELLGEGRKLADTLGVQLCGCLAGYQVEGIIPEVFAHGAEAVFVIDDPVLEHYRTEPYTEAIARLVERYKPEILLMGATSIGRDVFPAIATRMQTGLTADCTVLGIDPESRLLLQTRPAFGGNIMATILCRQARPQMATVRPRVMAMPERVEGQSGQIIREELGLKEDDIPTQVLEVIRTEGQSAFLDKAEIIVAVGLGLGSGKHMSMVEDLARTLGASIAGTRGAVEAGWISHDQQIGQTGITVRPKVYIAIGISGAIQHLVGMEASDCIIAVNHDPQAAIFRVANYGLIGDLFEIVPALTEQFQERLQYGVAK